MHQQTLHRRSIRLKGYDYRDGGMYFVTINTHNRARLFGTVENGRMWMNAMGCVAMNELQKTSIIRPYVTIDTWCVMPDHIHVLLHIDDGNCCRGVARYAPTTNDPMNLIPNDKQLHGPPRHSLGSIVRSYKSAVSKHINILRNTPAAPVWHRNYYEHIIRSEEDRLRIQRYILNNPLNYNADTHYDVPTIIDHARHI